MSTESIMSFVRVLVEPLIYGGAAVTVRTVFQEDDGQMTYLDNHGCGFLNFQAVVNADEIGISTEHGNLLIRKVRMGLFEVEFANSDKVVERCYACGRLYMEDKDYRDQRLSRRGYDPTDYECGCTRNVAPSIFVTSGLVWANPPYTEFPARPDADGRWQEFAF